MRYMHDQARRVVITGLGVVAPNGIGRAKFWQACIAGRSGIRAISRFDAHELSSRIAGEVDFFEPGQFDLTKDETRRLDRGTQLALAAANLAIQDAALSAPPSLEERDKTGVYIGSTMAYVEEGERIWTELTSYGSHPPAFSDETHAPASTLMTHASATSIAAHHQFHGPCMVIATGCSAGADAIGEAYRTIQDGYAERMLAGGTDSALCPIGLGAFCVMGAVSTAYNEDPARASRPYDGKRDGFVMAEGAGVLLLEERSLALARGAHIYAEIIAFASNSNAFHMTALPADGQPLQQLLLLALAESQIKQEQLDYINSHGSSTLPNELAETAAYKAIFGERAYHIPISATKSMIGHTQGAASAIEAIVTALVLDQQIIPPTINQEQADPLCDLDYVPNVARPATVNVALTHSSGFGGVNNALVLVHPEWITYEGI
ncbi:beta-ketoacyl-[acyl-carrier-protein] synthase family protein [Ktedonosporobacter rubrisoli]|uniref:Beta-ketoacyl-[acyl-carrier-protein] synthase family protein n=1 Tax=Ktedonosporobacter rubrisoli TaxID=2509675 RepID=A0A4V0Z007_KTERU|nr:beta-ketoacyl-[acyl-carrier-protein] synthase family protein [Ktedonosporobacter rubrisoli]QBD81561.1 beta-ketoacyl-[acyl-carrier-protein] synthase family protein [Ktedonosporobacter rubrisoli]